MPPHPPLTLRHDDLSGAPIRALIARHLAGMHANSPAESVHAFDVEALRRPEVTFWSAWLGEELVGCGALKRLDSSRGELKSMRVADSHVGRGVGRAILQHLIGEARSRGLRSLWLETGSGPAFEPAIRLYERAGFVRTGPFDAYVEDPFSVFMTCPLGVPFSRYELQTTDPVAAEGFYARVLGEAFFRGSVSVAMLPERAAARGAPAHWLGAIGPVDVERAVAEMVARGAAQLGPTHTTADGASRARLRDPYGAILAVSAGEGDSGPSPVAWHLHHGPAPREARSLYASLFGWTPAESSTPDSAGEGGDPFAWDALGAPVGSLASTVGRPHIHPQWLFFFSVADLGAATSAVQEAGGRVLQQTERANGDLVAPCVDPQGAAFGLHQKAPRPA